MHLSTRSRKLIDFVHDDSISVSYSRILQLECQLVTAVLKRMEEQGGVYIPPRLKKSHFYFAADNIDFAEDTPDGKNTLHGTMMIMLQQQSDQEPFASKPLQLDPAATGQPHFSLSDKNLHECDINGNLKPHFNIKYDYSVGDCNTDREMQKYLDRNDIWLTAQSISRKGDQNIPLWAAYNDNQRPLTNVFVLPLIAAPEEVIRIIQCACISELCKSGRCSCRKAGLVCTEMYSCDGDPGTCMNTERVKPASDDENEASDDEFDEC